MYEVAQICLFVVATFTGKSFLFYVPENGSYFMAYRHTDYEPHQTRITCFEHVTDDGKSMQNSYDYYNETVDREVAGAYLLWGKVFCAVESTGELEMVVCDSTQVRTELMGDEL